MDCNTARMLATFFGRQGAELAPEDAAALDAHVTGCSKCADLARFERAFDDRVAKAMLAVPVPAGLKGRLLDGVSAQRGAWYRQKFYTLAGLAAAIVLVIGGVVAWQIGRAGDAEWIVGADDKARDQPKRSRPEKDRVQPEARSDLNQLRRRCRQVPGAARARFYSSLTVRRTPMPGSSSSGGLDWKKLPQDGRVCRASMGSRLP